MMTISEYLNDLRQRIVNASLFLAAYWIVEALVVLYFSITGTWLTIGLMIFVLVIIKHWFVDPLEMWIQMKRNG